MLRVFYLKQWYEGAKRRKQEKSKKYGNPPVGSLSMGIAHYDSEKPLALDELMAQADTSMNEEMNNGNDDLHEGNRQESGRD